MIGSVFQALTESGEQHYVVLPDGVARVNDTTAAALRATNSYGLITPPSVEASVVASVPEQVYASPLPDKALEMQLREDAPTLCWAWQREPGDQAPKTTVIVGRRLPIASSAMTTGIKQIGGDATVYIDGGQFVRLQSPDPRYGESLYYIDPQGVRYGLPDEETARTLGLIGTEDRAVAGGEPAGGRPGAVEGRRAARARHPARRPEPPQSRAGANRRATTGGG